MTCPRSLAAKWRGKDYNTGHVVLEPCSSPVCFPALGPEAAGPAGDFSVCWPGRPEGGQAASRRAASVPLGSSAVRRCSRACGGSGRNHPSWVQDEDFRRGKTTGLLFAEHVLCVKHSPWPWDSKS